MFKPISLVPALAIVVSGLFVPLLTATPSEAGGVCHVGAPGCGPTPPSGPGGPGGPDNSKPYQEDPDPYAPPPGPKPLLISCRVDTAHPDLKFRNIGDVLIPKGTKIAWAVKETGEGGSFIMPTDLKPGESLSDSDVLRLALPAYNHCFSKVG